MTESTNPQTPDEAARLVAELVLQTQALRREVENWKAEMKPIDDLRLALYLFIEDHVTEAIDDRIGNLGDYSLVLEGSE